MKIYIWHWNPAAAKYHNLPFKSGQHEEGDFDRALEIVGEFYKAGLAVALKPLPSGDCLVMIDTAKGAFTVR